MRLASKISDFLWGPWTIIFIAFVSIYLTIRCGFFQIKKFGFIMKNTVGKMFEKEEGEVKGMTPFKATTTALASTVGMGNIAGVATALSVGGPGAIFWMWLFALLSMIPKTTEVTLAVHYRDISEEGHLHGGPMYYIKKGLGWIPLAKIFCIGIFTSSFSTPASHCRKSFLSKL